MPNTTHTYQFRVEGSDQVQQGIQQTNQAFTQNDSIVGKLTNTYKIHRGEQRMISFYQRDMAAAIGGTMVAMSLFDGMQQRSTGTTKAVTSTLKETLMTFMGLNLALAAVPYGSAIAGTVALGAALVTLRDSLNEESLKYAKAFIDVFKGATGADLFQMSKDISPGVQKAAEASAELKNNVAAAQAYSTAMNGSGLLIAATIDKMGIGAKYLLTTDEAIVKKLNEEAKERKELDARENEGIKYLTDSKDMLQEETGWMMKYKKIADDVLAPTAQRIDSTNKVADYQAMISNQMETQYDKQVRINKVTEEHASKVAELNNIISHGVTALALAKEQDPYKDTDIELAATKAANDRKTELAVQQLQDELAAKKAHNRLKTGEETDYLQKIKDLHTNNRASDVTAEYEAEAKKLELHRQYLDTMRSMEAGYQISVQGLDEQSALFFAKDEEEKLQIERDYENKSIEIQRQADLANAGDNPDKINEINTKTNNQRALNDQKYVQKQKEFANQTWKVWQNAYDIISLTGVNVSHMLVSDMSSGINQMVTDMVEGTGNMAEAFGQMALKIVEDLITMIIEAAIFDALMAWLAPGASAAGSGAISAASTGISYGGSLFGQSPQIRHNGGMITKAHSGMYITPGGKLASDEVPIIAQTGEMILSRSQTKSLQRGGGSSGGDTYNISPILNLKVNDAKSFKEYVNQKEIQKALTDTIKDAVRKAKA